MPSRRLSCCFCGGRTGDHPEVDYVELAVRFPDFDSSMIQFFGAHVACFEAVNAHGYSLERPPPHVDFDPDLDNSPAIEAAARPAGVSHLSAVPVAAPPRPPLRVLVPPYDSAQGHLAPGEGGTVEIGVDGDTVAISGDSAGLRDLARWCLAVADPTAPADSPVSLDPSDAPLTGASLPLRLARSLPAATTGS